MPHLQPQKLKKPTPLTLSKTLSLTYSLTDHRRKPSTGTKPKTKPRKCRNLRPELFAEHFVELERKRTNKNQAASDAEIQAKDVELVKAKSEI
jgi:hypothetical protein